MLTVSQVLKARDAILDVKTQLEADGPRAQLSTNPDKTIDGLKTALEILETRLEIVRSTPLP